MNSNNQLNSNADMDDEVVVADTSKNYGASEHNQNQNSSAKKKTEIKPEDEPISKRMRRLHSYDLRSTNPGNRTLSNHLILN